MSRPRSRSAKETLDALVRQGEADDAVRETLAMTDEQIERELAAAGFDLEAERRRAAANAAELEAMAKQSAAAPAPAPIPLKPRWRRWLPLLAAAALGVGILWISRARWLRDPGDIAEHGPGHGTANAPGEDLAQRATALRDEALKQCDLEQWEPCERLLDAASRIDGRVATEPNVMKARAAIAHGRAKVDAGAK